MRDGDQMSAFFFLTEEDEVERTWRHGHDSELAEPGPHPRPALLLLAGHLSIFLSASAVSGGDNTDRPRGRGPARGCAEGARRRSALLPSCPAGRTFAARPPLSLLPFPWLVSFPGACSFAVSICRSLYGAWIPFVALDCHSLRLSTLKTNCCL